MNEPIARCAKFAGKLLEACLSFFLLFLLSMALLWLGDKINAPGMAVTRFLARTYAPVVAQHYPTTQRDQIAVVLYEQDFLDKNKLAWPISYEDHADWLLRIVDVSPPPKAILLDFTFAQERADPSLSKLKKALCTITHDYKVPVFLAGLPDSQGLLKVRSGLESASVAGPCFTLVGVKVEQDPVDHLVWHYPLTTPSGQDGRHSGSGSEVVLTGYRSAALAMAEDTGGLIRKRKTEANTEPDEMALVWGYLSSRQSDRQGFLHDCEPGLEKLWMYIPGLFRQFLDDEVQAPVCPYHDTLSMSQLSALDDDELARRIGGRYLIVGAEIPGYNDLVDTPIHGLIPGPYMHAMALDNLLTFKADYLLPADWNHPSSALYGAALVAVAVVFLVHLVFARLFGKSLTDDPRRPLKSFAVRALCWFFRIIFGTIAALLVISLLQNWFRIGMLPVVELVTMSIAAEALDHLEKIKSFFSKNAVPIDREIQNYVRKIKSRLS